MPEIPVYFFSEDIRYSPKQKKNLKNWLNKAAHKEGFEILILNYIFCDDNYLLSINKKFLNHNTLTDIITFDNAIKEDAGNKSIEGDIFISYERVKENAHEFKVLVHEEIKRVMIHGLLHLMGYKDKAPKDKTLMREKENYYLEKAGF